MKIGNKESSNNNQKQLKSLWHIKKAQNLVFTVHEKVETEENSKSKSLCK